MFWFIKRDLTLDDGTYLVDARKSENANPLKSERDAPVTVIEADSWDEAKKVFTRGMKATRRRFVFLTKRR